MDAEQSKMRDDMAAAIGSLAKNYCWFERKGGEEGIIKWTVKGRFVERDPDSREPLRYTLSALVPGVSEPWVDEGIALQVSQRLVRRLAGDGWTPVRVYFGLVRHVDGLTCETTVVRRRPTDEERERFGSTKRRLSIPQKEVRRTYSATVTETFAKTYAVDLPAGLTYAEAEARIKEMCKTGEISPCDDNDCVYGRKVEIS